MDIFNSCKLDSSFDEMFDENNNVREHWQDIKTAIENANIDKLEQKQIEIDWRLEDNGVTYNIYNDPTGNNRRWNLDPIPFVLKEQEWEEISKGLKQRAKLLNLIFKDLYTEQKLIKEGIVPPEIIFAHKSFLPEVFNFENSDYYTMNFYAADISRGPDGKFWVINDRTQSPSGLGYAIENRLTMNSILSELYPNIEIKKIASFIENYKNMLSHLSNKNEDPLIVLLTPGPHNETYFEHSYLSSFLNLVLVQGEDLLTKSNQLWLKTLSGLKKVDIMIRRVDSRYCDPLELQNSSQLGVAGLTNVLRNNNLSMINPIGIGILENVGLNPFMENIAKFFLNEELILPQIATWWCGQKKELDFVISNIDNLLIKKIDRTERIEVYFGNQLTIEEKNSLIQKIVSNPSYYVGQEIIDFSTVPSYVGNRIEPRNAVIRSFAYKGEDQNYNIMPSGLVRVSNQKDSLVVSNQRGGTSKDLWILGKDEEKKINRIAKNRGFLNTTLEDLSTKRAENLFWLGRYLNRVIITSRMLRFNLKSMLNLNRYEDRTLSKQSTNILNICLTHLTMTYPGFLEEEKEVNPYNEVVNLIQDNNRVGSLSFTLSMLSNINANVKNLLTIDAWRVYDKMQKNWYSYIGNNNLSNREHINALDKLLIYLIAYKELIDESISNDQGLVIYDIGCKLETSLLLISKMRSLLTTKLEKHLEYDILDSMLNSYESYNAYRAYYKSTLKIENILELLLFTPKYPKSLIYIVDSLLKSLKKLPSTSNSPYLNSFEEPLFKVFSMLKLTNTEKLLQLEDNTFIYLQLDKFLSDISNLLAQTSEELTKTYFSHYNE